MRRERAVGIVTSIALVVCAVVAGWRQGVAERMPALPKDGSAPPAGAHVVREALPLGPGLQSELGSRPDSGTAAALPGGAEAAPPPDPVDRVLPHEQPLQRIAFTRYRLAWLDGDELSVRRLGDMQEVARIAAHGAQNVVALVGGGFLSLGRDRIQRVSGVEKRAERFARAPRLGPTTLLPSSQNAEQFWLYYEGIPRLPLFDLASEPIADPAAGVGPSLPPLEFTELAGFDRRALLGFGDGSMLYTTAEGLARIDPERRRERLPLSEIAGRVWRLARSVRQDQVWAATAQHLYRIEARAQARIIERLELPPHPLALASAGRELALLSIETVSDESAALRVDVYTSRADGAVHRRVLRFDDHPSRAGGAGLSARFLPEVALSPSGELVAAAGFGLHVYDWGSGRQLHPQNLAPSTP